MVRKAYVERAREAHPDRHIDASTADRRTAEVWMQEINEAWNVLGNARRRRRYDLETEPERRFVSRADGTMPPEFETLNDDDLDGTSRVIRGLPWVIIVFVLFAIFVFTAYAATGGDSSTRGCVTANGNSIVEADCGTPGARRVVTTVDASQPCPPATERLAPATGLIAYCLEV